MKKLFAVTILLILAFSVSAEPLTGFLGVPFRATTEEARAIMFARGYGVPEGDNEIVVWPNAKFAGRNAEIILYFFKDQFYLGIASIEADRGKALKMYNAMADDITLKYGKPKFDIEEYKSPYKKGDGYEETALYANSASIHKSWYFDNNNTIMVRLYYFKPAASIFVDVAYSDEELFNKYSEAKKSNDLSDL